MFRTTRSKKASTPPPKRVLEEDEEDDGNVVYIPMEGNPNLVRRVDARVKVGQEEIEVSDSLYKKVQDMNFKESELDQIVWLIHHSQESKQALFDTFGINSVDAVEAIRIKSDWEKILQDLVTRFTFLKRAKKEDWKQDTIRIRQTEDRFIQKAKRANLINILDAFLGPVKIVDPKLDPVTARKSLILQKFGKKVTEDTEIEYQFENWLASIPKEFFYLRDQIYELDKMESYLVDEMEQVLQPLLMEGMRPLYDFVGQIESSEGNQKGIYKHFYPLIKGNKTLVEFKRKNAHLGEEIIIMASKYVFDNSIYKPLIRLDTTPAKPVVKVKLEQLIGSNYPRLTAEQRKLISEGIDLADFGLDSPGFPQWVWCMIGSQCWKFMLSFSTYGAILMAAKELGYKETDLKALIDSDEVSYMFAQFVAHKFIGANKANAYASGIQGGQVQYRVSNGLHIRQANSKWLLGCKGWFRSVYWSGNPQIQEELRTSKERRDQAKRSFDGAEIDYILFLSSLEELPYTERQLLEMDENTLENALQRDNIRIPDILDKNKTYREARKVWSDAETDYFLARCKPERTLRRRETSYGFVTERDQQFYEDNASNAQLTANLMNQLRTLRGN